jgi:hypothetical protein
MPEENSLTSRLRYNGKRILMFFIGLGVLTVIIIWLSTSRNTPLPGTNTGLLPTPTPFQTVRDLGFGTAPGITPPQEINFEDPIEVPTSIKVFKLLPGPVELFSPQAMVAVAKAFGFTGNATVLTTGSGYTYYEDASDLTLLPDQGIVSYSQDLAEYTPNNSTTITPLNATDFAKNFVTKIGFSNPLYIWNNVHIVSYEIHDGNLYEEVVSIQNKGFYDVFPDIKLLNLPLVMTKKIFVRVGSDGTILGAYLWYPHLDMENTPEWEIIDYPTATVRARNNQGIYWRDEGLNLTGDSLNFSTSELVYFMPNEFISGDIRNDYYLIPTYRFGNNAAHLYVSALP